jgi:8-oxo-dGTP pyrophosphatase MutT (NUDIX family)
MATQSQPFKLACRAKIEAMPGSIRPGESPENAALREAREETGLSQLSVVRKLGEIIHDISPYRYEIRHRHVFQPQVWSPCLAEHAPVVPGCGYQASD